MPPCKERLRQRKPDWPAYVERHSCILSITPLWSWVDDPMTRSVSLDQLSVARKRLLGAVLVLVGAGEAALMTSSPDLLRVPAWVGFAACACFILTGLAIALHATLSRRAFGWIITVMLLTMTSIPAWIAFGGGQRTCRSNLPLLTGQVGCRLAFGLSTLTMTGIVLIAIVHTRRLPAA